MEKRDSFTLSRISEWAKNEEVSLPTVQRGFVWKPSQIENLWDSLLRGYPVGAFVLSQNKLSEENNLSFELLDGQQRATAICLGFGTETFRNSQDKIKLFIDLEEPKKGDNRKYIFRVITKSHPWGYQRNDNTKPLSSDAIRNAMILYDVDDHLAADTLLDNFFPFDAILPVPFKFFLNHNSDANSLMNIIEGWDHWGKIEARWSKEIENKKVKNKELHGLNTKEMIVKKLNQIMLDVNNMLLEESGQRVPALYLDFDKININPNLEVISDGSVVNDTINVDEDIEESDNETDEVENLFIRLNAGGTPLRGEELNYSILKAHINNELQIKIETSCQGLFNPARFITIAYRLFQSEKQESSQDAISMRIKPKLFQKNIKSDIGNFKLFIENILGNNKKFEGKTLLEYTRSILQYNKNTNPFGLPYLITSKLSDEAPEVMFMLLFRLITKKDRFDSKSVSNTNIHKRMIGMITLFLWLGKGDKQRDHAKLLSNIWLCVRSLEIEHFWSSATVQRATLDKALTPFPSKKTLMMLRNYKPRSNDDIWLKFERETNHLDFINKSFFNRDLILYAQRQSLSEWFKEEQYSLDDTNVPFDWDHISPNKFSYNRKKIPQIIKDCYNTNGNFRAWPYSLNRIDQDAVPAKKLNPLCPDNYPTVNHYEDKKKEWEKYFERSLKVSELSSILMKWSFCDSEWMKCKVEDLKIRSNWGEIYKLIINRNLSICAEWYDNLLIDELIPSNTASELNNMFDNREWSKNPRHLKEIGLIDTDYDVWVCKQKVLSNSVYIYLSIPDGTTEESLNLLRNDCIEFGIVDSKADGYISKISIPEKLSNAYRLDRNKISNDFTLITLSDKSYTELLLSFKKWLDAFPDKEIKKLSLPFIASLKNKYSRQLKIVKN